VYIIDVRQRDLAKIAGLSLGMTNAILKRLALKGLLTIKRVNNRNIHYIVTPTGIEAITRKSYRYFKRTIKNVVYKGRRYKQQNISALFRKLST
jgi:DNA-binding MarR family transcriptional regulator